MNFSISSQTLLEKLLIVGNALKATTSLPILENFLFEIKDSTILITASDLNTTICSKVDINVENNSVFNIAIPAKFLIDTLKTFSDTPLSFFINEDSYSITISSTFGKYDIQGEEAINFPKVQEIQSPVSFELTTDSFVEALGSTLIAVSQDELRPVMTGVLFDFTEDFLHFVSSDGSKLIKHSIPKNSNKEVLSQLIIPAKSLSIVKNVLGQTNVEVFNINFNESGIEIIAQETSIVCRLIDGNYPNYNAVIPKGNSNTLIVEKDVILSSLRRVSMFASKATFLVKLNLKGNQLKLTSKDVDFMNAAEETITVDYKGDDLEIGFNAKFLFEMINAIPAKEVCCLLSTPTTGVIIKPESDQKKDITMLLMPLGG